MPEQKLLANSSSFSKVCCFPVSLHGVCPQPQVEWERSPEGMNRWINRDQKELSSVPDPCSLAHIS